MVVENSAEAPFKRLRDLPHDASLVLLMEARKEELLGPVRHTPVDDLVIEDQDPCLKAIRELIVNPGALILPRPFLRALSCLDRWVVLDL